jgi:hypothetical protein
MSKVIKTVALVAIAVAVVVFAAPIAGALAGLGAGVASAATIAAVTASVVGVGISLGLSAALSLFRKAPSISQSSVQRLSQSIDPTAYRKIIFGRTAAGNDMRFAENAYGSKSDRSAYVIALASHKVNAIKTFYVEDDVAWNGSIIKPGLIGFRAVTEGNSSNGQALGSGRYWNSTATFTGCAYIGLTWKNDPKLLPNGIPTKTVTIVEGCPVYDPRRDSANGGSGSHRPDNQNSWGWSADGVDSGRNPALALLTYLIGWKINGSLVWGMGVPLSRINLDSFRAYANICEEAVSLSSGGSVQRYTIDGIFSTSDSHESIISAITACMGSCKLNDLGGHYQLVGGYDDTLGPKIDFDENDLVGPVGQPTPYSWVPAPSIRDTFNIASGRFANPSGLFQLDSWGTIITAPQADGIPRTMTLDFGAVTRAETCQRIAKQFLLKEAKCPGVFTALFGPKAFAVQVGSLVTLSLGPQGWNKKLFRVQAQAETHDLLFQMTLREESSEVYAWDREEKPLPFTIRPPGYDPLSVPAVEGLRLNTTVYEGVA